MMFPSSNHLASRTFVELLRSRAEQHGARTACTFLTDGDSAEVIYSYAELDQRARRIGGWLQAHGATGQPVLLVYPQGLDFVAAFFGCLYAGAIAVPAYPPRRNRRAGRICCMVSDANVPLALTTGELRAHMADMMQDEPLLARPRWQSTEELDEAWANAWHMPNVNQDSLAFLQYTSGSIGTPKGVMVTHGNLLENQRLITASFRQSPSIVCVGWLPLHHDMGLIGNLLHPLYQGGHFVFMSPVAFVQQPIRWLRAITKYRGTLAGGPNFGYDLCVTGSSPQQRAELDLSSWEVAYTGAERVQDRTLREFEAAFAPYHFTRDVFCPCYGLAETTLLATGSVKGESVVTVRLNAAALQQRRVEVAPPGTGRDSETAPDNRDAKPIDVVGCGIPDPALDVRIVDPESHVTCDAGQIGEIWISGATVTRGYWGKADATRESFQATLTQTAPDEPRRQYLRTGDLGFLWGGHLYITGRLKDLIIVRGGNHYPSDIERTAGESHACLIAGSSAAFSIEVDNEERVVIVQELQREHVRTCNPAEVCQAIRQAIVDDHLVPLHAILLVRPGSVPKTTSGKIQRGEARRMYLAGEFKRVASWETGDQPSQAATREEAAAASGAPLPSATDDVGLSARQRHALHELQQWILSRLSERLGIPTTAIDVDQPFARYGIDSLKAVRLSGELEEHLGRPVAPTSLYDYPNVSALVRHLVLDSSKGNPIVAKRSCTDEPIAVVGIGCRFPGSSSPDAFWDLLRSGRDAIGPVPTDRWGETLQRVVDQSRNGRPAVTCGGFLDQVDQFDPSLFGIPPREAEEMDPQQRLLLEVVWETFEAAGVSLDALAGSRTGVFLGVSGNEYAQLQSVCGHRANIYRATGNSLAVIANRVSFLFDFHGPSWAVDTACSSSLVAVHQGCASLRRGECDAAVVGGVSLILSPDVTSSLNQTGMLSPIGRCQAFAAGADGFVRGEGCGVVLLKRVSDAQAAGDRILCVLRGSAVNQDGRSNGLTAPSAHAQQAVLRSALADAQLTAQDLDYVEAHGTGTALGDPIEMGALHAVFAADRDPQRPLRVGSVKTNIGHLEGAAGIAGLIKVVLALTHQALPPHLHFQAPSTHIDWRWPVEIPVALTPWTTTDQRPRRAGVSSFGFGGTNAHVILEEAPPVPAPADPPAPPAALLVLAAHTPTALAAQARQLAAHWPAAPVADIAYTAAVGRAALPHRLAVVVTQPAAARQTLETFARDGQAPQVLHGQALGDGAVAWLFPGQGGLRRGAGRALMEASPTFRALLDDTLAAAARFWPADLRRVLWDEGVDERGVDVQPAQVVLQIALGQYWRAVGVEPQLLLGHSLGEYAAACLAGVCSLDDALRLVCARAQLIRDRCARGRMLAVLAPEDDVRELLTPWATQIAVAAVNGPRQTVLSGAAEALEAIVPQLAARAWRCRELQTTHAFHSPLVEPALEAFRRIAEQVTYQRPQWPYVSSLTGTWAQDEVASADYWCRHLREAVRFSDALQCAQAAAPAVYLEVGAGSTLSALVRSALRDAAPCVLPGLSGDDQEWTAHLTALGQLYVRGTRLCWSQMWGAPRRKVTLPSYPFERQRYWFTAPTTPAAPAPVTTLAGPLVHPLLGRRLELAGREIIYETDLQRVDYLADHRWDGQVVFPATGYLELALAAGREAGFGKLLDVRDLKIRRPLTLAAADSGRVQVVLTPDGSGLACRMLRAAPGKWHTHATCRLEAEGDADPELGRAPTWVAPQGASRAVAVHYARCRERGLDYGPAFQGVQALTAAAGESWGVVALPAQVDPQGYLVHPALLDACLQVTAAALGEHTTHAWLPIRVARYRIAEIDAPVVRLHVHTRLQSSEAKDQLAVDILATDDAGRMMIRIDRLQLRRVERKQAGQLVYREQWIPKPRAHETVPVVPGLSSSDLAQHLESHRAEIVAGTGFERHTVVLDELERLCTLIVYCTLIGHGPPFVAGKPFTTQQLADSIGVLPQHARLLRRLLAMLEEDGYVRGQADAWTVAPQAAMRNPDAAFMRLLEQRPTARPEIELLQRCASRLLSVMRGETDPLKLLFPADDSISAGNLYRDSVGGRTMNALVAEAVAHIGRALPDGRTLRVLEIGAGTGATTESILQQLPAERVRYVFTDIAASLLAQAKEQYKDRPNIEFRMLDVERDPTSQGFAAHSFDLIIAANVLHATRNLRDSLTHVRHLMASGGKLVVLEGTRPVRWLDLTFGLTSGWWRFDDNPLRAEYPLLSIDGWRRLLDELGWEAIRFIPPFPMLSQDRTPESAVILSQVDDRLNSDNNKAHIGTPRRWIVLADDHGYGGALVTHLQKTLHQPCLSTQIADHFPPTGTQPADQSAAGRVDRASLARLWASAWRPTDVVFLWSLADMPDAKTPEVCAQQLSELLLQAVQSMTAGPKDDPNATSPSAERLRWWIVTRGAQLCNGTDDALAQAPLWGLARTLALEYPQWDCRLIDLDPDADRQAAIGVLIDEVSSPVHDADNEIVCRDGLRRARRLIADTAAPPARDMATVLQVASRGTLAGLTLVSQSRRAPRPDEVELEVHASGLNFRDVLSLLGQYPGAPPLGAECAGRIVRVGASVSAFQVGDEVVAVAPHSFCDYLTVDADAVVKLPSRISLRDAATIPIVFLTASVALTEMAHVRRGNRVLIHSATGGVGLAAVQLARSAGAEIFATASEGKHETLHRLGIEHVYDSRRTGFGDRILEATAGDGVDIVLNTLGAEFLPENLHALAANGHYVDITKTAPAAVEQGLSTRPDVVFHTLDLAALLQSQPERIQADLIPLLNRFAAGQLQPLPSRCFALTDAQSAFRFMRSARHIGKIVIQPDHAARHPEAARELAPLAGAHGQRASIRSDACYLITGGLGGLGLEVAHWLAQQGARHIGLLARRQPTADEQRRIAQIHQRGAAVEILQGDVSRRADVQTAIELLPRAGRPLAGVFHLAGVLDDALIARQSSEKLSRVFAPKVAGTWHLHCATLDQPLDWFVLFSSAAAAFGSPGQANHAAANAFLDALACYRRSRGLSGQTINWGPWSDIGAAASLDVAQRSNLAGIGMLTPAEGITILDQTLAADRIHTVAVRLDWEQLPTRWKERPLFEKLMAASVTLDTTHRPTSAFLASYRTTPEIEKRKCLLNHLRSLVGRTLGIADPAKIPSDRALADLGLDSLAALELTHCIEESLETTVSSTLVYDFPTLNDMVGHFAPILPNGRVKSSASSGQIPASGAMPSMGLAERSDPNATVASDQLPLPDDRSPDGTGVAQILQGIHELSEELDRWDEV